MYNLEGPKLPRVFKLLPDSIAAKLVVVKQVIPVDDVVKPVE